MDRGGRDGFNEPFFLKFGEVLYRGARVVGEKAKCLFHSGGSFRGLCSLIFDGDSTTIIVIVYGSVVVGLCSLQASKDHLNPRILFVELSMR